MEYQWYGLSTVVFSFVSIYFIFSVLSNGVSSNTSLRNILVGITALIIACVSGYYTYYYYNIKRELK